jgi:methyl-accepting chemotaxis protein
MMHGAKQFIFYKPFTRLAVKGRSMETLNWHVGIVYPKEDVYGEYDNLLYYVFALAIVGLILMYILCHVIIRYMLHPLKLLTTSAQRIAEGKFDERIPASHHSNEIGHLQDNFRAMQQSLAVNIGEMEQQKATLQEREEELKKAYNDIKKADRMKTAFLHNMTNQMINPAAQINKDVSTLCAREESAEQMVSLAENIQKNGDTITKLLNDLIDMSEEEMRKEDAYEED